MDCVETILNYKGSYPVGYIGEGEWCEDENATVVWMPAEVLNVRVDADSGEFIYYVHYLGQEKQHDDWLVSKQFRELEDLSSIRLRLEKLNSQLSLPGPRTPPKHTSEIPMDSLISPRASLLWPGFFSMSQLTKQTSSGGSAYHGGSTASSTHYDPHEFSPKTVVGIEIGRRLNDSLHTTRIRAWYRSPYDDSLFSIKNYLNVCDRCLGYGGCAFFNSHVCDQQIGQGIGTLVYDTDNLSVFEVDGLESVGFCIRLLLLSKLFLEDKRTAPDGDQSPQVTPFLFYILVEKKEAPDGTPTYHFVGYFSKYKVAKRDSPILSCIMVLPSAQRKGYGKLLISIAYELTKREGRQGSAERPLSRPGYAAFIGWWINRMRDVLGTCFDGEILSIAQLSELSGMTSDDVVETLRAIGALKQWGGSSNSSENSIKLRESGKRAKIKLTHDMYKALDSRVSRKSAIGQIFDNSKLSENARLCPAPLHTPSTGNGFR